MNQIESYLLQKKNEITKRLENVRKCSDEVNKLTFVETNIVSVRGLELAIRESQEFRSQSKISQSIINDFDGESFL
jgi:hypothetical protein